MAGQRTFVFEYKPAKTLRALRRKQKKLAPAAKEEMGYWSSKVIAEVITQNQSRPGLESRTGNLIRALRHRQMGRSLATTKTSLYALRRLAPYARIHEYGTRPEGTLPPIRPKRATFLAVPITGSPALDSRGVKQYESPLWNTLPSEAGIRAVTTGPDERYLMDKLGRIWYKLVDEVTIKPRLRMRDTVRRSVKDLMPMMRYRFQEIFRNG